MRRSGCSCDSWNREQVQVGVAGLKKSSKIQNCPEQPKTTDWDSLRLQHLLYMWRLVKEKRERSWWKAEEGCRVVPWRSWIKVSTLQKSITHKCWLAERRLLPPHYTFTFTRDTTGHARCVMLTQRKQRGSHIKKTLSVHSSWWKDVNDPTTVHAHMWMNLAALAEVSVRQKWSVHSSQSVSEESPPSYRKWNLDRNPPADWPITASVCRELMLGFKVFVKDFASFLLI